MGGLQYDQIKKYDTYIHGMSAHWSLGNERTKLNWTWLERSLNKCKVLGIKKSYCQMWCMASSSGILFLIGNLFNSIDEFNAGYNIS